MRRERSSGIVRRDVQFGDLNVSVPDVWEDRSVFLYVRPNPFGFEASFSVARAIPVQRKPLDQHVRDHPVGAGLDGLLIVSRDFRRHEGREIFERVYRFVEPLHGMIIKQAQRFFVHSRDLIIMTLTSDLAQFDEIYSVFDRVGTQLTNAPEG